MKITKERIAELKMLHSAPRHYVPRKSDVSNFIVDFQQKGFICHRSSLLCECKNSHNVRQGVVVIDKLGVLTSYTVRCKACYSEQKKNKGGLQYGAV
jgi:hypothetical protein